MVVGLRAPEIVEQREVALDVVGDPVEELVLVDRAVRTALATGPVVGHEDDQRVIELVCVLEVIEQAPDLVIGVGEEPGVDLGHPGEQALLVVG